MRIGLKRRAVFGAAMLYCAAAMMSCGRKVIATAPAGGGAGVGASCSLEASAPVAHSGDVVRIHARSVFPNGDGLTYFWTLQGGTLKGNGADMVWRSKDATPGTYVIRARVEDSHGNEASCSVEVEVAEGFARRSSR